MVGNRPTLGIGPGKSRVRPFDGALVGRQVINRRRLVARRVAVQHRERHGGERSRQILPALGMSVVLHLPASGRIGEVVGVVVVQPAAGPDAVRAVLRNVVDLDARHRHLGTKTHVRLDGADQRIAIDAPIQVERALLDAGVVQGPRVDQQGIFADARVGAVGLLEHVGEAVGGGVVDANLVIDELLAFQRYAGQVLIVLRAVAVVQNLEVHMSRPARVAGVAHLAQELTLRHPKAFPLVFLLECHGAHLEMEVLGRETVAVVNLDRTRGAPGRQCAVAIRIALITSIDDVLQRSTCCRQHVYYAFSKGGLRAIVVLNATAEIQGIVVLALMSPIIEIADLGVEPPVVSGRQGHLQVGAGVAERLVEEADPIIGRVGVDRRNDGIVGHDLAGVRDDGRHLDNRGGVLVRVVAARGEQEGGGRQDESGEGFRRHASELFHVRSPVEGLFTGRN